MILRRFCKLWVMRGKVNFINLQLQNQFAKIFCQCIEQGNKFKIRIRSRITITIRSRMFMRIGCRMVARRLRFEMRRDDDSMNLMMLNWKSLRCMSLDQKNACSERVGLFRYYQQVFEKNLDKMLKNCQNQRSSLNYSVELLKNMLNYSIGSQNQCNQVFESIESKLDQLNPRIVFNLVDLVTKQHTMRQEKLSCVLYNYISKNFYQFSDKELEIMEQNYMYLSRDLKLTYSPYFESMISYKKSTASTDYHTETKDIFRVQKIEYDRKELDIVYQHDKSCMIVNFKKFNKIVRLYGISHYNFETIFQIKNELFSARNVQNIMIEYPPLSVDDLRQLDLEQNGSQLSQLDKDVQKFSKKTLKKTDFNKLLENINQLNVLNQELSRQYINEYIRKRADDFRVSEPERIVYTKENQLGYPHEFATLIYYLSETKKLNNTQITLLDLNKTDEIFQLSCQTTDSELQQLYEQWKYIKLNDELDTIVNVYRNGCNICSNHEYNISSLINLVENEEYNFEIMENNLARQILTTIQNSQVREHIVFLGRYHLLRLIKQFNSEIKNFQPTSNTQPLNILQVNEKLRQTYLKIDYDSFLSQSEDHQKSIINRMAMYSTLFNYPLLFPQKLTHLKPLFDKLTDVYRQELSTPNITQLDWNSNKSQQMCYQVKLMFPPK